MSSRITARVNSASSIGAALSATERDRVIVEMARESERRGGRPMQVIDVRRTEEGMIVKMQETKRGREDDETVVRNVGAWDLPPFRSPRGKDSWRAMFGETKRVQTAGK